MSDLSLPSDVHLPWQSFWRRCYAGLALFAALMPWLPRWLPTQDGPQHLRLTSFVLQMRADPASPFHGVFHDGLRLTTASLFAWFCALISPLLSIEHSERLYVSFCILGWAFVAWVWTRAVCPNAPLRAFLFAPFFINWFTTIGFLPYLASVPLGATAVWVLWRGREMWRVPLAAALIYLCYLGHISSFLVTLLCCVLLAVQVKQGRGSQLLRVALAFLPTFAAVPFSLNVLEVAVSTHQVAMSDRPVFPSEIQVIGQFFLSAMAGVTSIDRAIQALAVLLELSLLSLVLIRMFRRSPSGYAIVVPERPWTLAAIGLLLFGFSILPTKILGWSFASTRLLPFAYLLLPAAVAWPATGSRNERRLTTILAAASLIVSATIGTGWISVGRHLDHIARAAQFIQPGTRLMPMVFNPGADAPWGPRQSGRSLHSWAIASRLSSSIVPFGFENMRRLMLMARKDASPPFPSGAGEDAGRVLWNSSPEAQPRVYAQYPLTYAEITDEARFVAPAIGKSDFYASLRLAVLHQAAENYHYLLAIDPPTNFLTDVGKEGWPQVFSEDGIYVFRLKHPLTEDVLTRTPAL